MLSIKSLNLFLLVGVLYLLLCNIIWPVKDVFSCCNGLKSKSCYINKNIKERLYSLLFDVC